MITADNITDQQLRHLQANAEQASDYDVIQLCRVARGVVHPAAISRDVARARCAEIINARAAKETK